MLKRIAEPFAGPGLQRWWLWLLAIGLAPLAYWTAFLLPVPERREPHIDHAEALRRANAFAQRIGVRTDNWSTAVNASLGAEHQILMREPMWKGLPAERRNLAPITTIRVVLTSPSQQQWIAVWLRPDGALHGFDTSPELLPLGPIPVESESRAKALAEAQRAFPGIAWGDPELETAVVEGTHGARRYLWRTVVLPGVESTLTVEVHCDRITERTTRVRVHQGELPVRENEWNGAFGLFTSLAILAGAIYAVYRFSRRALEREISWTRTAAIVGTLSTLGLAVVFLNPNFGAAGLSPDRLYGPFRLLIQVSLLLTFTLEGIAIALIYGAGEGEMREHYPGKITSLDALFTGRWLTRNVGRSVVFGLAAGGWALLALRLTQWAAGHSELRESSLNLAYGRATWAISWLGEPVSAFLTACVSLLMPLLYLSRHVSRSHLRRALAILLCVIGTSASRYRLNFDDLSTLAFPVVLGSLVLMTFWYGDFLAAVVSLGALFSVYEQHAIAGVVTSWTTWANLTYLLASVIAVGALAVTYLGPTVEDVEVQPQHAHRLQERLQLQQEVNAAREAQIRLLPDGVPTIPGIGMAASCHPAREVGGDFYDFFPLSRQRHGIFVADGSAGGLASALTIGLAKGFLSYAAQRDWPPAESLQRLAPVLKQALASTRHHFSLCYAVLDPAAGEIRLARLGHNPRLFHFDQRRRAEGKALVEEVYPPEEAGDELRLTLSPGDLVLFCTDGLATRLEAKLGGGLDAWLARLNAQSSKSAERFHEDLLRTVNATGTDLVDDITAVVIERQMPRASEQPVMLFQGLAG